MPSEDIPIDAVIEALQKVKEESDTEEPTLKFWRGSNSIRHGKVFYREHNLPGIPKEILEKHGVDIEE